MRIGHIFSLIGAVMVVLGGTVLDWQLFKIAGLTAKGTHVPPAGQIVVGLAVAGFIAAALGLAIKAKRRQFAGAGLVFAVFTLAYLIIANVTRASSFALMSYEEVELLGGFSLAVLGGFTMFIGPLVVFSSEPPLDPNKDLLRVALLWKGTVLEEKVLEEPQTFTVGEAIRNNLVIPAEKLPQRFPLFKAKANGSYQIGLDNELDGEITINRETKTIADFAKDGTASGGASFVNISAGDWGMVHLDEVDIFFQFVRPEQRMRAGLLGFDEYVASAIAVSAVIQLMFLVGSIIFWEESTDRLVKDNARKDMVVTADINEPEKKEEEEAVDEVEEDTSKKAEGEEGKFGDPDEDPEKKNKIPKNDGKMVDKIDPKKVGLNDLLSTNKLGGSGAIASLLSANSEGLSNKLAVAMDGTGSVLDIGHGSGGLGFSGTGTGGGGEGGLGRIHGMGKMDTGGGMGVKAGLGGSKKKRRVGRLKMGGNSATGFCKKSNIRSVVRRRAGAIRACYEKRLLAKPKLKGKLTARWTIGANGKVKGAGAGGSLKDGNVKGCILRVIRRMRFAKPEGGICVIKWPFVFSSSG